MSVYTSPAYRRVKKHYRYKVARGIPTSLVDATPYREHLTRVVGLGWTLHGLESQAGDVSHQTLRLVLNGVPATIERKTAAAIARLPYTYAVAGTVPDDAFVPAEGAVRRVRALLALGWTRADVQAAVTRHAPGVNVAHIASAAHPRVKAAKWRAVAAAYDELHMRLGPSSIGRIRARKAGHPAPLAWDDIDAPDATPRGVGHAHGTRAEQVVELAAMGHNLTQVCARLKVGREALWAYCRRHGIEGVYDVLAGREDRQPNQYGRAS